MPFRRRLPELLAAAVLLVAFPAAGGAVELGPPEISGSSTFSQRTVPGDPSSSSEQLNHRLSLGVNIPRFRLGWGVRTQGEFNFEGEYDRLESGAANRVNREENLSGDLELNLVKPTGFGFPVSLRLDGSWEKNRQRGGRGPAAVTRSSNVTGTVRLDPPDLPAVRYTRRFNFSSNAAGSRSRTEVVFDNFSTSFAPDVGGVNLGNFSYSFNRSDTNRLGRELETTSSTQRLRYSTQREIFPWLKPDLTLRRIEKTSGRPQGGALDFRSSRRDIINLQAGGDLPVADFNYNFRFSDEKSKLTETNFSDERNVRMKLSHPIPAYGSGDGNASLRFLRQTSARPGTVSRNRTAQLRANTQLLEFLPLQINAERRFSGRRRAGSNDSVRRKLELSSRVPLFDPADLQINWRLSERERTGSEAKNERRFVGLSTSFPLRDELRVNLGFQRSISTNSPGRNRRALKTENDVLNARLSWRPSPDLSANLSWRMTDTFARELESQETDVRLDANYRIDNRRNVNLRWRLTRNASTRPSGDSARRTERVRVSFNYSL